MLIPTWFFELSFLFVVLGNEPGASGMLGNNLPLSCISSSLHGFDEAQDKILDVKEFYKLCSPKAEILSQQWLSLTQPLTLTVSGKCV